MSDPHYKIEMQNVYAFETGMSLNMKWFKNYFVDVKFQTNANAIILWPDAYEHQRSVSATFSFYGDFLKLWISMNLQILGNIYNVSTQLQKKKKYNTVQVLFGYFDKQNKKILTYSTFKV